MQVQVAVGEPDDGADPPERSRSTARAEGAAGAELASGRRGCATPPACCAPDGAEALDGAAAAELVGAWPPPDGVELDVDGVYDGLAGAGLEYGPAFQGLRGVWRRGEEVFAEVELGEAQRGEAGSFGLHPALLDAALHAVAALSSRMPRDRGGRRSAAAVRLERGETCARRARRDCVRI